MRNELEHLLRMGCTVIFPDGTVIAGGELLCALGHTEDKVGVELIEGNTDARHIVNALYTFNPKLGDTLDEGGGIMDYEYLDE